MQSVRITWEGSPIDFVKRECGPGPCVNAPMSMCLCQSGAGTIRPEMSWVLLYASPKQAAVHRSAYLKAITLRHNILIRG